MSELPDLAENRISESSNENLFGQQSGRRHGRIINKRGRTKQSATSLNLDDRRQRCLLKCRNFIVISTIVFFYYTNNGPKRYTGVTHFFHLN